MLIAVHWDQKGHSISTPWQRTDQDIPFSKLGLHLAPAASNRVWHAYRMAGNFRGVLIFVIFVVDLAVTKFSTHEN